MNVNAAVGVLATYAVVVGFVGPHFLARARWPVMRPRLGLMAWGAGAGAFVVSTLLLGAVIAAPDTALTAGVAEFLHMCTAALDEAYRVPGDMVVHAFGAVMALTVLGWLLSVGVALISAHRRGNERVIELRQAAQTARAVPAARAATSADVITLDHGSLMAFCLGGSRGVVVVTTATRRLLDDKELAAVLAHERAHQWGRHHAVVAVARGLARGLPWVPLLRLGAVHVGVLVEMAADDAAVRRVGRDALVSALVKLATGSAAVTTTFSRAGLAAADTGIVQRLGRLRAPRRRSRHRFGAVVAALGTLAAVLVAVAPLAFAAAPFAGTFAVDLCPLV